MPIRIPRGFSRNVPNYQELCEGVRPTDTAAPREAYTGLPHVRIDQHNHDPYVLDAGTVVGRVSYTGASSTLFGKVVPCVMPTGMSGTTGGGVGVTFTPTLAEASVVLRIKGSTEASDSWGMPDSTSGDITNIGVVKPLGVIHQPIYSFILNSRYTNYKRNVSVGVVTDYVILVPATNAEEAAIRDGDVVVVGSGDYHGFEWGSDYTYPRAGRYARYNVNWAYANERVVGRCLKKIRIATTSSTSAGTKLSDDLDNITLTTEAKNEFGSLDKVQTVPGLGNTGSATKGIPSTLLDARLDGGGNYPGSTKCYWALVLLIRL